MPKFELLNERALASTAFDELKARYVSETRDRHRAEQHWEQASSDTRSLQETVTRLQEEVNVIWCRCDGTIDSLR